MEREVKNARQLWNDTNNLALDHMDKLKRIHESIFSFHLKIPVISYILDNQSSWEKFDDQKTNLTMAIDLGEKEKNDIQRVLNFYQISFVQFVYFRSTTYKEEKRILKIVLKVLLKYVKVLMKPTMCSMLPRKVFKKCVLKK